MGNFINEKIFKIVLFSLKIELHKVFPTLLQIYLIIFSPKLKTGLLPKPVEKSPETFTLLEMKVFFLRHLSV
jgi:hypothetical protein